MKKVIFYIILIISILILSSATFWNFIGGIGNNSKNALLNFKSLFGNYNIYIDEELKAEVLDKQSTTISQITSGNHNLRIERISNSGKIYHIFEKKIKFYPNSQVQVEWESGPTLESSNGIIKYFTDGYSTTGTELDVIVFPLDAEVRINDEIISNPSILIKDEDMVNIKISKEFYESKELDLQLSAVQDGTKHIVEVYLYKIPFIQE